MVVLLTVPAAITLYLVSRVIVAVIKDIRKPRRGDEDSLNIDNEW